MNKLYMFLFCAVCMGAAYAVSAALFPYAAKTLAEVEAARTPAQMEDFDLVDLGEDYGQLTVFELVGYYLETPPAVETLAAPVKKKHFGGC